MKRRNRFEYLSQIAEALNDIAKEDGRTDRYVVIATNNKEIYKIVCLKEKKL